eukprot:COSAG01_NODE_586_length_15170_cov_32.511512_11_plen_239_part_00
MPFNMACPASVARSLPTEAVLALQLGVGLCTTLLGSGGGGGGAGAALSSNRVAGAARVLAWGAQLALAGLLVRNTALSMAILPAQLVSREPRWRATRYVYRRLLARVYGLGLAELVTPWEHAAQTKQAFVRAFPHDWQELTFSAADGVLISGGVWRNPRQASGSGGGGGGSGRQPGLGQRWLLFACPNGQQYEQLLFELAAMAQQLHSSLVVFNYRGVGASGSGARRACELVLDAEAA